MKYRVFLEHMEPLTSVLSDFGFSLVAQAKADVEMREPFVVFGMGLAEYAQRYPELAAGDLQIESAEVVVTLRQSGLEVLVEGDPLHEMLTAETREAATFGGLLDDQVSEAADQVRALFGEG